MCFLGAISQSHLRVTECGIPIFSPPDLPLCHLWVCAPHFSQQSHSPSCRCLPCSSLHLCTCFLSCLMYVYNLRQRTFGCIYLSKPVSLCTCLCELDRQIIVPCVFTVTTHFHTGLYNGFASYIPQAS